MARTGPKPQSIEEKKLRGNPGRRPLNTEAPQYEDVESAKCPKDLKGVAKDEWNRVAPLMLERGVLKKTDLRSLREYCQCAAELDLYVRLAHENADNMRIQMQCQDMVIKLRTQFRMMAAELGLSPSSRSNIKASRPTGKQNADKNIKSKIQETNKVRFFDKKRRGVPIG